MVRGRREKLLGKVLEQGKGDPLHSACVEADLQRTGEFSVTGGEERWAQAHRRREEGRRWWEVLDWSLYCFSSLSEIRSKVTG